MNILNVFRRDHERYAGVRPIHIYLLRILFALVVLFVATGTGKVLLTFEGQWEPVRAAAFCMWFSYALLSIVGVVYPLKMLPIVLFEILYKSVWLAVVAWPLWSAGQLAGSPAEAMTRDFLWLPLAILATPWKYVWFEYVLNRKMKKV